MNRTMVTLSVFLIGALLLPAPGDAQIRLIPQVGLYASVSDLGTVDTPDGVQTLGEQGTSLAYGLTLDMSSAKTIGYRVTALYGSDSEVPVDGIGCTGGACDLRTTLLGVSAGIVLRPFPVSSPFRPYILAGGGFKRYDFDFESDSPLKDAFGDESQATVVLGLGFDWNLGILKGNLELADYISGAFMEDGDRQHDFFLTVGLILG
ncbi:MAG: hypothetical protein ABIF09_09885 [Gemmatimonadota bacterium]